MKAIQGFVDFNPAQDIPSLSGKVIFVSGGTAGIGAETVRSLAAHDPAHIYFSGRNASAGQALITSIQQAHPSVHLTLVEMDLASLASVKSAVKKTFVHDRLDILVCNAGIMAQPPSLSADGYEIQFATNHLGHAMLIQQLLPILLSTAKQPNSDVRVVSLTSLGYRGHPSSGICFPELSTEMSRFMLGSWTRYGQSKLANILYASELARRYPSITSVSIHPGVVRTGLVSSQSFFNRVFLIYFINWLMGIRLIEPGQGAWNSLWCAAAAKKEDLTNGGFYLPVGVDETGKVGKTASDAELAGRLWDWTEGALMKVE